MSEEGPGLAPGDTLRIERRYIVDGQLTCVTDVGKFQGIERVGSAEHLVIKDPKKGVRLFPLSAIAEITLVKAKKRAKNATPAQVARPATAPWDPAVA